MWFLRSAKTICVSQLGVCAVEQTKGADYLSRLARRLKGEEAGIPSFLGRKTEVPRFAKYVGVQVPESFFVGAKADLAFSEFPDEFVLKPDFASTSMGVHLLRKDGDDFIDLSTGHTISEETLFQRLDKVAEKYYDNVDAAIYRVEQLLRDHDGGTPPSDLRCYCFQGVIGMILKENHQGPGPTRLMYFDGDFRPFVDLEDRYSIVESVRHLDEIVEAVIPNNWRAIKAVAERVSRAVPSPFVRVDLYDTPDGVFLGELTFYPGPYYYGNRKLMSPMESERLGRLWGEAEERLKVERGHTGE